MAGRQTKGQEMINTMKNGSEKRMIISSWRESEDQFYMEAFELNLD